MDALENFDESTEEELESIEWLLLIIDYVFETITYSGAIFTFLLMVSLIYAFLKGSPKLSTAYFHILAIGYLIIILSVISYVISSYAFPKNVPIIAINNVIQWYAKLFVGFWNTLLVLNRLTAMLWWHRHDRLWSGKFLVIFIGALLLYPIAVNGYSFRDLKCALNSYSAKCTDFIVNSRHFAAIANGANAVIVLILGIVTALSSRIQLSQRTKATQLLEKRLLLQSLISSVLFGTYCVLTAIYSILYPIHEKYPFAFDITRDLSNVLFMVFNYSSGILLMVVSKAVRENFVQFYRFRKSKIQSSSNTLFVRTASQVPGDSSDKL